MTLNMRTYKGYGKLPYCEAHVPKAKPTTMAETPELKRIAENTKIQSNVKYHADFEKSKGKFTQVADDPETLRIKANTKIISNVAYHGELEKKAQMEKQRQMNENGELVDVPSPDNYHQQIDNYATEMLSPTQPPPHLPPKNHYHIPTTQYQAQVPQNQVLPPPHQVPQQIVQPQSTNRYPDQTQYYKKEDYPYQYQDYQNQYYGQQQPQYTQNYGAAQPKIGRIQDYDPLSDGPRAPPNTQRASATVIYNSTSDKQRGAHQSQQQQQQQSRQIGRVTDLDPLANEVVRPTHNAQPQMHNQRVYIAMYDYEANDSDEVSFREGDLIMEASAIDEGWMTGRVARTGRAGMLPANYVEPAPAHLR